MEIYLYQEGQQVGPYDEEQIRSMVASGTILDTEVGWHAELTDWQPLNTFLNLPAKSSMVPLSQPRLRGSPTPISAKISAKSSMVPLSQPREQKVVETNVKQGAIIGGTACFILGIGLMYLSMWSFFFYGPLFLVAFILSIVAMSQRRVFGGIMLLLATLICPAVLGLILFTSRTGELAASRRTKLEEAKRISALAASMSKEAEAAKNKTASSGVVPAVTTATEENVNTIPTPAAQETAPSLPKSTPVEPAKPKHPELQAKMGFRTYKLGTLLAKFNLAELNEGQTFIKSDLTVYFVKTFDKKLGAAEIKDIQLNFRQDILEGVMVKVDGEQSSLALKEVLIAAFGQPDKTSEFTGTTLEWTGDDCELNFKTELLGGSYAKFSSKSVNAKIKGITEQKAKAGAADGVKGL